MVVVLCSALQHNSCHWHGGHSLSGHLLPGPFRAGEALLMGLDNPWQPLDALAVTAGAPLRRFPSDAMHVHVQHSDDSSTCALLPAGGFLQVVSAAAV